MHIQIWILCRKFGSCVENLDLVENNKNKSNYKIYI